MSDSNTGQTESPWIANEGWMEKRGRLTRSWKRRYIRLKQGKLMSFLDKEDNAPSKTIKFDMDTKIEFERNQTEIAIITSKKSYFFRAEDQDLAKEWARSLRRAAGYKFAEAYRIGKKLGSGGYGVVRLVEDELTGQEFACKIIDKPTNKKQATALKKEIVLMKNLKHNFIVSLEEVFEEEKTFLVMECMRGGELFDRIVDGGPYSERDAQRITHEILQAISYLHSRGVVHRDLKPENLLCQAAPRSTHSVKIADFGLSGVLSPNDEVLTTMVGTPGYVAPEILNRQQYGKASDMWSFGVILYIILSGIPPFYGSAAEIYEQVINCRYDFPYEEWRSVSPQARQIVKRLLVLNPATRPTADDLMEDPWFEAHPAIKAFKEQRVKAKGKEKEKEKPREKEAEKERPKE